MFSILYAKCFPEKDEKVTFLGAICCVWYSELCEAIHQSINQLAHVIERCTFTNKLMIVECLHFFVFWWMDEYYSWIAKLVLAFYSHCDARMYMTTSALKCILLWKSETMWATFRMFFLQFIVRHSFLRWYRIFTFLNWFKCNYLRCYYYCIPPRMSRKTIVALTLMLWLHLSWMTRSAERNHEYANKREQRGSASAAPARRQHRDPTIAAAMASMEQESSVQ